MITENARLRLSSLEYFLGDRCNLRCEFCAASSPFLRDVNLPDLEEFRRVLQHLAPVLSSEQIKFVGGEPLMNRAICDFLRVARDSGVFTRVRVTTNGVLLSRMPDEFWALADIVEISRYPGIDRPDEAELSELRARAAKHEAKLELNRIDRFMLPTCDSPIEDTGQVEQIFRSCGEANNWSCHLLYRSRLYRCSRVHSLDRYLTERGIPHEPFTELDGLPIDDRPGLLEEIRAYLASPKPLRACRHCLGTSGRWVENRQLTPEEIRQRMALPPKPFDPKSLVSPREAHIRKLISTWSAAGDLEGR